MVFYSVVTEFYDSGRVSACIHSHTSQKDVPLPKSKVDERSDKDVYTDYFATRAEAIKFCDEAKNA